ncbi:UNVERIFIED_CONTAM: PadR family transcriptional regulator AphA [Brevibacillus sp. OAP136]
MSIKLAILGILSWKPSTGYDIKKIMEESSFMYWSGNNNQIYKSLVQLLDEGFVTNEVLHHDSSPTRKIYTITDAGHAELKEWVNSDPLPPENKNSFLTQLAWADLLNPAELNQLLTRYENEISLQVLLQQEKKRRGLLAPKRSPRETLLWEAIHDNIISTYKNEWQWIQAIRKQLDAQQFSEEANQLKYQVCESGGSRYIDCQSAQPPLATEQGALDLIAACIENDTNLLLLQAAALSDFFNLRTGAAGAILQKFVNYHVKAAAVLPEQLERKGKFKEMVLEANKGSQFRVFATDAEAIAWLLDSNRSER